MTRRSLPDLITHWSARWHTPDLAERLTITFSARLRRSLGRCRPATGRITLQAALRDGPPERLAEVLCHEAAHVAVYLLHGASARPHGDEWRALVTAAGFTPRVHAGTSTPLPWRAVHSDTESSASSHPTQPTAAAGPTYSPRDHAPRLPYEHRCPVCHTVRYARGPVPRWRCAECLDVGLAGELCVTRRRPERDAADTAGPANR